MHQGGGARVFILLPLFFHHRGQQTLQSGDNRVALGKTASSLVLSSERNFQGLRASESDALGPHSE